MCELTFLHPYCCSDCTASDGGKDHVGTYDAANLIGTILKSKDFARGCQMAIFDGSVSIHTDNSSDTVEAANLAVIKSQVLHSTFFNRSKEAEVMLIGLNVMHIGNGMSSPIEITHEIIIPIAAEWKDGRTREVRLVG